MLTRNDCFCCNACVVTCPHKAISLVKEKGFLYPKIDEARCTHCGLCDRVCTIEKKPLQQIFGIKNRSNSDLSRSTSGGVYLLFARMILERGGVVYGAKDDHGSVTTCRATTVEEALEFCGSKYVHCDTGHCFQQVRQDLTEQREVLFTGTPCQINGLKQYLKLFKIDDSRLLTIDFICHGTPSPELYSRYIQYVEKKRGKAVKKYLFRVPQKKWFTGVCSCASSIQYTNGQQEEGLLSESYMKLFFDNMALKPACYTCPFVGLDRVSDLTMGDFWGIEKVAHDFYSPKGVSLLIVNNQKGAEYQHQIADRADFLECDAESAFAYQHNMSSPTKKPQATDQFWLDFESKPFAYIMKNYARYTTKRRFRRFVKTKILRRR